MFRKKSIVLWFTGLSGSGKSTIMDRLKSFVKFDGDVLRKGLCSDLGFSEEDRKENMRRLREVCKLFSKEKLSVAIAAITPFEKDRLQARQEIKNCYIVWVNSSLEKCEERDVKGLYKKARSGDIKNFTGIDSPFEHPESADLILDTENESVEESVKKTIEFIKRVKSK